MADERCVNCGGDVARPVWAIYADEAFAHKKQDPFPLHPKCFKDNETVPTAEWVNDDDGQPVLKHGESLRYRKVPKGGE